MVFIKTPGVMPNCTYFIVAFTREMYRLENTQPGNRVKVFKIYKKYESEENWVFEGILRSTSALKAIEKWYDMDFKAFNFGAQA